MSVLLDPHPPRCQVYHLGLVPYQIAWQWQKSLVQRHKQHPESDDVLLLLEHPPVYTLGQGADPKFIKFNPNSQNAELYRVERGGEVTYHCPGQLVGYPILNLRRHQQDLHWYLRQLEEVIIRVLAVYGVKGDRIAGLTGVWIADKKVAAIGIKVSRWITMHGFAINVCPDLEGFEHIVPCGISDRAVGRLIEFIPTVALEEVRSQVQKAFAEVFGVELIIVEGQPNGE
ncbi:lipoyl(octanoyl) transferase [Lyngbya aestuarii BL J]|uniref:Octanoyltransferase n=1 Tax=Lyngbya aestuarii BL J TaxID=1348334 RepID=U7QLZ4_9CYAN|nr:lipoyl(octanoyl) transferase LipB [Lyngbya aestuarii]ERT07416.1 lipoyl(octanoyl) transferase [Lyngbya aestuarii BL J]